MTSHSPQCQREMYNYFLKPGNTLRCEVEVISIDEDTAKFKGSGYVADRLAVSARLELKCMEMADKARHGKDIDERITAQVKEMFELVGGPAALAAVILPLDSESCRADARHTAMPPQSKHNRVPGKHYKQSLVAKSVHTLYTLTKLQQSHQQLSNS